MARWRGDGAAAERTGRRAIARALNRMRGTRERGRMGLDLGTTPHNESGPRDLAVGRRYIVAVKNRHVA
jgi:hypothetical protein